MPGSSPKMLAKSASLPADEVFFDLEDSVVPVAKASARANIVDALRTDRWGDRTVAVRINSVQTQWAAGDVEAVVEGAGRNLDCIMVPKVEHAHEVMFVDHLLRMIEVRKGLERSIGIEAQIETAVGLENAFEIAHCSPRLESLIFGPADMSASLGLPAVTAGVPMPDYPGDHWHWVMVRILVAARSAGLQAIDGPYLAIRDLDGLRVMALRARALGYDGKWAVHPDHIAVLNEVFTPTQQDYEKAEAILEAYERATEDERRGAVMFGTEMIDEASRKMASRLAERGRAAGMKVDEKPADREGD